MAMKRDEQCVVCGAGSEHVSWMIQALDAKQAAVNHQCGQCGAQWVLVVNINTSGEVRYVLAPPEGKQ